MSIRHWLYLDQKYKFLLWNYKFWIIAAMEIWWVYGNAFCKMNIGHVCSNLLLWKISYLEISAENFEKNIIDIATFCIAVKDFRHNSCRKFKYSQYQETS